MREKVNLLCEKSKLKKESKKWEILYARHLERIFYEVVRFLVALQANELK
jgi:hypothetical protein